MKHNFKISIVIPILNEEGNILTLAQKLQETLKGHAHYEIIFVDDGSTDNTLSTIKELSEKDSKIKYLSFSRNFGHQNALKAGLDYADGDCVISMDGDMQHPPELIPEMIKRWQEGNDIVYTSRKDDPQTGFFKKMTSRLFYKLMNYLSDINIEHGSADFRLLDKNIVMIIRKMQENPLFFRGMIRWLGFRQYCIKYMPHKRLWGKSKYSISKMFKLAVSGILNFSIKPLHISTILGSTIALLSFTYGVYAIYIKIFTHTSVEGWTSLLIVMSFIGGIQLIMIGILGEYIGKMFIESKRRPNYIIKEMNYA